MPQRTRRDGGLWLVALLALVASGVTGCAESPPAPTAVGSSKAAAMRAKRAQSRATESVAGPAVSASEASGNAAASSEPLRAGEVKPGSAQSPLIALMDDARAEEVTSHLAIPNKVARYSQRLLKQYDQDQNGVLQPAEWASMRGNAALADLDHDGQITPAELSQRIAIYSLRRSLRLRPMPLRAPSREADSRLGEPLARAAGSPRMLAEARKTGDAVEQARNRQFYVPAKQMPAGVGDWFVEHDADGDGQITMREFSGDVSEADVGRFSALDQNGDGVVTAAEYTHQAPPPEEPPPPMDASGMPPLPAPMLQR